jgi:tRNA A37 threonylcarbamoyltransferase TsaD
VLGETLDIGIGNMLDKFARTHDIPFPGGPVIERMASEWLSEGAPTASELELPYAVHGMDLAFSGILTAAVSLSEREGLGASSWSLQEHSFASCIEVSERALAHTGKTELLLGGGVACNGRLREMAEIMCEERGATAHWPEKQYCIDNGTMIAELGRREIEMGRVTNLEDSAINPMLRTDSSPISWN